MTLEWLPRLALVASVAAFLLLIAGLRGRDGAFAWSRRLGWLAAAGASATFVVLLWAFIDLWLDIQYVFLYSGTHVPLRYRIAGTWAGREGSLVLWTMFGALLAGWVGQKTGRAWTWTRLGMLAVSTAFLGAVVAQQTFAPTPEFLLTNRPGGNGLNPTLWSPFILIHPPMMFMAYAMTAIPAAAALGSLAAGHGKWSHAILLTRYNWILYTFAMGLGGIWAYYTLGFGGYWAWDPVELANLLPWLALTLYLHAQTQHLKNGRYAAAGPFLAILPFVLTLFSTISTRSGLWVSVHAFTDPTNTFNPDAPGRFLDILQVEAGLGFYVAMILVTAAVFLALWARRLAHRTPFVPLARALAGLLGAFALLAAVAPTPAVSAMFAAGQLVGFGRPALGLLGLLVVVVLAAALPILFAPDEPRRKWKLDFQFLAYASILTLGASLLLFFLFHMSAANGWSEDFYIARLPLLATPAVLGIVLLQARNYGTRPALWIAGGSLLLGLLGAYVTTPATGGYLFGITLPAVLMGVERVRQTAQRKGTRGQQVGFALLLLAALLNVVFWLNPPSVIGWGALTWEPRFPVQVFLGGLALLQLYRVLRHMAGQPGQAATAIGTAALGGFYVAAPLALLGWWLSRDAEPLIDVASIRRRMPLVGVHLVHLAIMVALLGYTTSTYFGSEETVQLAPGTTATVAGADITFHGSTVESDGRIVTSVQPQFSTAGRGGEGTLYWESQSGAYLPLPGTIRLWNQDVYFATEAICKAPCERADDWVQAFDRTVPLHPQDEPSHVQVEVFTLPGLGLVWAALLLLVLGMFLIAPSARVMSRQENT